MDNSKTRATIGTSQNDDKLNTTTQHKKQNKRWATNKPGARQG